MIRSNTFIVTRKDKNYGNSTECLYLSIKKLDSRPIWLPDKLGFRTACYKYYQVYGRLLDELVRENIDSSSTCLQVD